MLRMTFAGMSGLMTMLLMACGGSAPAVAVCDRKLRYLHLSIYCLLLLPAGGDGLPDRGGRGEPSLSYPDVRP